MNIHNKICKYYWKANERFQILYGFLQICALTFTNSPTQDLSQEKVPKSPSPLPTKLLQVWEGAHTIACVDTMLNLSSALSLNRQLFTASCEPTRCLLERAAGADGLFLGHCWKLTSETTCRRSLANLPPLVKYAHLQGQRSHKLLCKRE